MGVVSADGNRDSDHLHCIRIAWSMSCPANPESCRSARPSSERGRSLAGLRGTPGFAWPGRAGRLSPRSETSMSASGGKIEPGTKSSVAPSSGWCSQVNSSEGRPPEDRPSSNRNASGMPAVCAGIGTGPEVGADRALGIEDAEVLAVPAVLVAFVPARRVVPLGARGQAGVHPVVDRGDVVARIRAFRRRRRTRPETAGRPTPGRSRSWCRRRGSCPGSCRASGTGRS